MGKVRGCAPKWYALANGLFLCIGFRIAHKVALVNLFRYKSIITQHFVAENFLFKGNFGLLLERFFKRTNKIGALFAYTWL